MRKITLNKKTLFIALLLIILISNFGAGFSFFDNNTSNQQVSLGIGEWDYAGTNLEVTTFRTNHSSVLALTEETITISDKANVELALADYGLLSEAAKIELSVEETLLLSLFNQIIAIENSEFLDFEGYEYDSGLTGTVEMNDRTWYANDVFISNDSRYDVWNDTRSLALRSTAYFESQDFFINGIDKITIYFGALNYDNGVSYQFKVEYELASNPGVWSTLQENGSDILVDVTSATPLGNEEIDVSITEALNIRFTPVIGSTSDYINLDDITIYEHVQSSEIEVTTYRTIYAGALSLTEQTVEISDKSAVEQALSAYDLLSIDSQNALTTEKSLLDSLLAEINLQEDILEAEQLVIIAEASNLQSDVDAAQVLITALPSSQEKIDLQIRLDYVQETIDDINTFQIDHSIALSLTVETVTTSDQSIVESAISAYESLTEAAKTELTAEKALLDSLLIEINNQIPTALQVSQFRSNHATVLALTVETVEISYKEDVQATLTVYNLLTEAAKTVLTSEKSLLDSLLSEINLQEDIIEAEQLVIIAEASNLQTDLDAAQFLVALLPSCEEKTALQDRIDTVQDIIDDVANFLTNHATVLGLTEETVAISDKANVESALSDYGLLSQAAMTELSEEKTLLISLYIQIIKLENCEHLDFEGYEYDYGLTGTVEMNGRTWYGYDVFIANDPSYDVWNDTRSLALRSTAYFESQDFFVNGIDQITIHFGALNYDNGVSYQFKIEYELASNPGVWLTLQENGSDMLVDVTSATPLGYAEIDVNITESLNIRFVPVIGSTSDYINLDDITVYEHVPSSEKEVNTYSTIYSGALSLTVQTVEISDKEIVEQALLAYDLLSIDAQNDLTTEKALLDSLLVEINLQEA